MDTSPPLNTTPVGAEAVPSKLRAAQAAGLLVMPAEKVQKPEPPENVTVYTTAMQAPRPAPRTIRKVPKQARPPKPGHRSCKGRGYIGFVVEGGTRRVIPCTCIRPR